MAAAGSTDVAGIAVLLAAAGTRVTGIRTGDESGNGTVETMPVRVQT